MEIRAAVLAGLLFFVSYEVYAEPVLEATEGGVRVVLHTDKCALNEVSNLPFKAVWHENGKQVEGCWAPHPPLGIVAMFFAADKSVGIAPMSAFRKVVSI